MSDSYADLGRPGVVADRIKAFNERATKAQKDAELHRKAKAPVPRETIDRSSNPVVPAQESSTASTTANVVSNPSPNTQEPAPTATVQSTSSTISEPTGSSRRRTTQKFQYPTTTRTTQPWRNQKESEPLIDVVHGFIYAPPDTHPPHLEHSSGVKNTIGRKPCPHHKHAAAETRDPLSSQDEKGPVPGGQDTPISSKISSSSPSDQSAPSKAVFVRVDANGQRVYGNVASGTRAAIERTGCRTCNNETGTASASTDTIPAVPPDVSLKIETTQHPIDKQNTVKGEISPKILSGPSPVPADTGSSEIKTSTREYQADSKPNRESLVGPEASRVEEREAPILATQQRPQVTGPSLQADESKKQAMGARKYDSSNFEPLIPEATNLQPPTLQQAYVQSNGTVVVDVPNKKSSPSMPDEASIKRNTLGEPSEKPVRTSFEMQANTRADQETNQGFPEKSNPSDRVHVSEGPTGKKVDEKFSKLMDAFQPTETTRTSQENPIPSPGQSSLPKQPVTQEKAVVLRGDSQRISAETSEPDSEIETRQRDEAIKDAQDVIDAIVNEHSSALLDVTTRLSQEISQLTVDMRLKEGKLSGHNVLNPVMSTTEIIPKLEEQSILLSQLINLIETTSEDWQRSNKSPLAPVVSYKADAEQKKRAKSFSETPLAMPLPLRRACSTPALPSGPLPNLCVQDSIHTIEVLPIGSPRSKWYIFPLCHVAIRPYNGSSGRYAFRDSSRNWEDRSSIFDAYVS